jgi:geranylgeranylglycerol-phosphate geranylgeranyltransferase
MVGLAVIVGMAVASRGNFPLGLSIPGFMTGFLISSFSMVCNDYYDVEIDKVNQPSRPLATGRIARKVAVVAGLTFLLLGLASSAVTGLVTFSIASVFAFIAWFYNFWGKKKGIGGNMLVAASVAVPYIYGGAIVGGAFDILIWALATTSFLAATGREVVKAIADVKGDEMRNVHSVARRRGEAYAAKMGSFLFLLAVASSSIPALTGSLVRLALPVYMGLILVPDGIFIYLAKSISSNPSPQNALLVKKRALAAMLSGLLAYLISGIV